MRNMKTILVVSVLGFGLATGAGAEEIPASKRTTAGLYVTASDAAGMLADPSVVLIDIRSRAEVAFLGLPERADVHLPYMVMQMVPEVDDKGTYPLELNPDFPMEFSAYAKAHGIGADTPIILMCRSGNRSARAADLLNDMGYTRVYSMIDGFEGDKAKDGPHRGQRMVNGWRNAGLAWSYAIDDRQVYPGDR